jgi:hypothetical protein
MPLLGRSFLARRPGSRRAFLFRAGRGLFLVVSHRNFGGVTQEMYNEFHYRAPSDREADRALAIDDVSALREAAFKLAAAPLPPQKPRKGKQPSTEL